MRNKRTEKEEPITNVLTLQPIPTPEKFMEQYVKNLANTNFSDQLLDPHLQRLDLLAPTHMFDLDLAVRVATHWRTRQLMLPNTPVKNIEVPEWVQVSSYMVQSLDHFLYQIKLFDKEKILQLTVFLTDFVDMIEQRNCEFDFDEEREFFTYALRYFLWDIIRVTEKLAK